MALQFPQHSFFHAAAIERIFPLRKIAAFKGLSFVAAAISIFFYLYDGSSFLLGFVLLSIGFLLFFYLWSQFIRAYDGRGLATLPPSLQNLSFETFTDQWPYYVDFSLATILTGVWDQDNKREILSKILWSSIGDFFFERLGLDRKEFLSELDLKYQNIKAQTNGDFSGLILEAAYSAARNRHYFIMPSDMLAAIAVKDQIFSQFLISKEISAKDFDYIAHWLGLISEHHRPKSFLERLLASPGIGKGWAYGYSVFLDRHSRPIRMHSQEELHILAHKKEITALEEALAKEASANAVVIGQPGVGKMTLVKGLVKRINEGKSHPALNYGRVLQLSMADILADKKTGGVEETLSRIFRDAEIAGHLILVIEDIEQYLTPGLASNIAESLLPFFRSPRVKIIGITTPSGYAKSASEHPVLGTLFNTVRVEEPDEETVITILEDTALDIEKKYKQKILYGAIKKVYDLALHLIADAPFPEKGINLLEGTFVYAKSLGEKEYIGPEAVEQFLERKFGATIGGVKEKEKEVLMDLEARLHQRVINQAEGIKAISDSIRRKRTGVSGGGKPVGSFLFLGPTGVGKTETAKALAEAYFGSDQKMIRFDMSEYQNINDLGRLIGSIDTREVGVMAEKVRANPFSLILLDEIEKAHPNILNLFLQVLDEARATDAFGKKIDFTNSIIIATSNAGSELIRQSLNAGVPYAETKKRLVDEILKARTFSPEFINRFDGVIIYVPLGKTEVRKVAELMLGSLRKRLQVEGYGLEWSEEALSWLVEKGYSEVFGGRELRRVIQEKVESRVAKDILAGKYKKGDTVKLDLPF